MKLAELGLKTKPATKYFDGGYYKFKTVSKVLYYQIVIFDQRRNPFLFSDWNEVKDFQHLKDILATKSINEVVAK